MYERGACQSARRHGFWCVVGNPPQPAAAYDMVFTGVENMADAEVLDLVKASSAAPALLLHMLLYVLI